MSAMIDKARRTVGVVHATAGRAEGYVLLSISSATYLLDDDGRVVIERRDASLGVGRPDDAEVHAVVDCVAGNLPWNLNTPAFEGDNSNILRTVRALLRPGAPCAIVSGGKDVQKDMPRLGYKILATASIPQSNFKLPKSKKAKKGSEGSGGRSMCVVTIAVAK